MFNSWAEVAAKAKEQALCMTASARDHVLELSKRAQSQEDGDQLATRYVERGFGLVGLLSVLSYTLPVLYQKVVHRPQNLKNKYNAEWAVVTGGSSGIVSE